jgi:hypothetical protein
MCLLTKSEETVVGGLHLSGLRESKNQRENQAASRWRTVRNSIFLSYGAPRIMRFT